MESGLVDLSLFAYSPTVDNHFSNINRTNRYNLYSSATWPDSAPTNRSTAYRIEKPLPKTPKRNLYDFCIPTTGSRCVLRRIRRVKLDTIRGDHRRQLQARTPSAYASAPSAYINPNSIPEPQPQPQTQFHDLCHTQTLQERRNPADPQLTLPNDNVTMAASGLPMVWLEDEQMWLVADPTDPSYGYYATGPEEGDEWLPPYTENDSPTSEPSQSDFSPVREQFLSLIEAPRRNRPPPMNPDEPQMSPLFQEALAGVGMLNFDASPDYEVPNPNLRNRCITRKPVQSQSNDQRHITARSRPLQPQQDSFTPYNYTNNPWEGRTEKPISRPKTPRSESPALRAESQTRKYYTEEELQRQKERSDRRRIVAGRQPQQYGDYTTPDVYNRGYIPYGHGSNYQPSGLSRRESWHSDSITSVTSSLVSPEPMWPIRASSARH